MNSNEYTYPYVHCSVIHKNQDKEAAKCPSVDEWIKQLGYLYNGILLAIKKKKTLPFATVWVDLENIMLNEISQSEKDKYRMISLIGGI